MAQLGDLLVAAVVAAGTGLVGFPAHVGTGGGLGRMVHLVVIQGRHIRNGLCLGGKGLVCKDSGVGGLAHFNTGGLLGNAGAGRYNLGFRMGRIQAAAARRGDRAVIAAPLKARLLPRDFRMDDLNAAVPDRFVAGAVSDVQCIIPQRQILEGIGRITEGNKVCLLRFGAFRDQGCAVDCLIHVVFRRTDSGIKSAARNRGGIQGNGSFLFVVCAAEGLGDQILAQRQRNRNIHGLCHRVSRAVCQTDGVPAAAVHGESAGVQGPAYRDLVAVHGQRLQPGVVRGGNADAVRSCSHRENRVLILRRGQVEVLDLDNGSCPGTVIPIHADHIDAVPVGFPTFALCFLFQGSVGHDAVIEEVSAARFAVFRRVIGLQPGRRGDRAGVGVHNRAILIHKAEVAAYQTRRIGNGACGKHVVKPVDAEVAAGVVARAVKDTDVIVPVLRKGEVKVPQALIQLD